MKKLTAKEDRIALGNVIRQYRDQFKWSRKDLAMRVECSTGNIQTLENGQIQEPSSALLARLAIAFGLRLDYFDKFFSYKQLAKDYKGVIPQSKYSFRTLGKIKLNTDIEHQNVVKINGIGHRELGYPDKTLVLYSDCNCLYLTGECMIVSVNNRLLLSPVYRQAGGYTLFASGKLQEKSEKEVMVIGRVNGRIMPVNGKIVIDGDEIVERI
jgi:transcriptional regulator with XRE-family HTH domain